VVGGVGQRKAARKGCAATALRLESGPPGAGAAV